MARIVVTGANRGIGLELCRLFKGRGDSVVGVCRSTSPELDELGISVFEGVDVGDDASVKALGERYDQGPIDVLVNNAGVMRRTGLAPLDTDAVRTQFEVNSLGPLRVTSALLGNLGEGSKVGIVTSRMGSIADNTSGGSYGYRMSKAAVNIAGVSLAQDLKKSGIAVVLLHPGFVRTDMTGGNGSVEPADAAAGLAARIDELTLETTGSFRHQNGEALPW